MKWLPALIRIGCGVTLLAVTASLFMSFREKLTEDGEHTVEVLGHVTSLAHSQVTWFYVAAGIVGLAFFVFGLISAVRVTRHRPSQEERDFPPRQ